MNNLLRENVIEIEVSKTHFLVPLKKQMRKWFEWYISKEIFCREQTGSDTSSKYQ